MVKQFIQSTLELFISMQYIHHFLLNIKPNIPVLHDIYRYKYHNYITING